MKKHLSHPWKIRSFCALIIVFFSFVGLILTNIHKDGAVSYWNIMIPFFALICLFLSWYLRRKNQSMSFVKIWHELLHWGALIAAVYLVHLFVGIGMLGKLASSLVIILLLALTLFTAGIYIEFTFMIIGVLLGFFVVGAAFLEVYLYSIILPITLIVLALTFWWIYKKKDAKKTD